VGEPASRLEPGTPAGDGARAEGAPHSFRARGEALCRRIYGSNYTALRANIRALHPDLDAWMVDEGYGRVLARGGVDVATRELAALTALVVLDVPRQLRAHLRGALNVGASAREIAATLDQAALVAEPHVADAARAAWREVALRIGYLDPGE
jgi:4-carboxymuconolactone decarboxylase